MDKYHKTQWQKFCGMNDDQKLSFCRAVVSGRKPDTAITKYELIRMMGWLIQHYESQEDDLK